MPCSGDSGGGDSGVEFGCAAGDFMVWRGKTVSSNMMSVDTIVFLDSGFHRVYPLVELLYPMNTSFCDIGSNLVQCVMVWVYAVIQDDDQILFDVRV